MGQRDPPEASETEQSEADLRTFLVADIRGYTSFTQLQGAEAAGKLTAKFAALTREQVEARGGAVLELRGDEALAVFHSPRQALQAAVEMQARFAHEMTSDPSLPLAVGIGVDAGEAVRVEGGYRGGTLNLAARLCSRAGPGQVWTTQEAVHLAQAVPGLSYTHPRPTEFKGLSSRVGVVEVTQVGDNLEARIKALLPPTTSLGPGWPGLHRLVATTRRKIGALAVVLVTLAATSLFLGLFG